MSTYDWKKNARKVLKEISETYGLPEDALLLINTSGRIKGQYTYSVCLSRFTFDSECNTKGVKPIILNLGELTDHLTGKTVVRLANLKPGDKVTQIKGNIIGIFDSQSPDLITQIKLYTERHLDTYYFTNSEAM